MDTVILIKEGCISVSMRRYTGLNRKYRDYIGIWASDGQEPGN